MSKTKILFLNSGNGGNLMFVDQVSIGFNFEVVGIIADRNCGAIEYGKLKSIPVEIMSFNKGEINEVIRKIIQIGPDIVITNIHKILQPEILEKIPATFINLHYSILPSFKGFIGMKTVDEGIKLGCNFYGATCHFVNDDLDGGEIICQGITTQAFQNVSDLKQKVFEIGCYTLLVGILSYKSLEPFQSLIIKGGLIMSRKIEFDSSFVQSVLIDLKNNV